MNFSKKDEPRGGDLAFNLGSDARLAGFGIHDNPYQQAAEMTLWRQWRCGWLDVEDHWGKHARRRVVPKLPEVTIS